MSKAKQIVTATLHDGGFTSKARGSPPPTGGSPPIRSRARSVPSTPHPLPVPNRARAFSLDTPLSLQALNSAGAQRRAATFLTEPIAPFALPDRFRFPAGYSPATLPTNEVPARHTTRGNSPSSSQQVPVQTQPAPATSNASVSRKRGREPEPESQPPTKKKSRQRKTFNEVNPGAAQAMRVLDLGLTSQARASAGPSSAPPQHIPFPAGATIAPQFARQPQGQSYPQPAQLAQQPQPQPLPSLQNGVQPVIQTPPSQPSIPRLLLRLPPDGRAAARGTSILRSETIVTNGRNFHPGFTLVTGPNNAPISSLRGTHYVVQWFTGTSLARRRLSEDSYFYGNELYDPGTRASYVLRVDLLQEPATPSTSFQTPTAAVQHPAAGFYPGEQAPVGVPFHQMVPPSAVPSAVHQYSSWAGNYPHAPVDQTVNTPANLGAMGPPMVPPHHQYSSYMPAPQMPLYAPHVQDMSVNSHQQYSSSSYAMPAPQMLDASYVEDMSINATADFDSIASSMVPHQHQYSSYMPQMLDASHVEDMSISATAAFGTMGPSMDLPQHQYSSYVPAAQMSADASHEEMSVDIRSMGSSMVLPQHPYSSYVPAPQMQADVSNGEEMSANVPMDSDSMGPSMVTPESQYLSAAHASAPQMPPYTVNSQYTPFDGSTVFADNQTDAAPASPSISTSSPSSSESSQMDTELSSSTPTTNHQSMLELVQQLFASNPTLATEGNPAYDGEVADTDAFMNDYMKFD